MIFLKTCDVISACCCGQVIVEDHCEFEESTGKESQEYSDFDIFD